MHKNRYFEILSCELDGPAEEWADDYRIRFRGLNGYTNIKNLQSARISDVHYAVGLIALHHLGYDVGVDPRQYLNAGVDVAVDYFYGDWWQSDKKGAKCVDKSAKKRGLEWFGVYINGLMLALLSQRWKDVEKLCDWVEADIVADQPDPNEEQEKELSGIYKSIAASLRKQPMPGLEKIEVQIRKTLVERSKLLFAAWDAARNRDQQGFQAAIEKSLKHYLTKWGKGALAVDWIAPHQSVVIMAARRLGMKPPELPEELQARVICPESIA